MRWISLGRNETRGGFLLPSFDLYGRGLLLDFEVLDAGRNAVRRDLHVVLADGKAGQFGDMELVDRGASGGDVQVLFLDDLAGVAEGPLGVELHARRSTFGGDRGVDRVLRTEGGRRVGHLLVGADGLADVDRVDLEGDDGGGGIGRNGSDGNLRRGGRRRSLFFLLLTGGQRQANGQDQQRGAVEAHGVLSHLSYSEGIFRVWPGKISSGSLIWSLLASKIR